MVITDQDIRYAVVESLSGDTADYDIDRIVEELISTYDLTGENPTQDIDDNGVDFWGIVLKHDLRGHEW